MKGWLILTAAWAIYYAISCWWFPYGKCRKCKGGGRVHRGDGKVFRVCPRCKGNGRRLRVGRAIYNAIDSRRKKATR